jgi:hypothetical protein
LEVQAAVPQRPHLDIFHILVETKPLVGTSLLLDVLDFSLYRSPPAAETGDGQLNLFSLRTVHPLDRSFRTSDFTSLNH